MGFILFMESVSLKQLFQQEYARMVAVISKTFGLQYIEIAEDLVSDTFLVAAETWGAKGVPANPAAWLYMVAKQKAIYHFRRNKIYEEKVVPAIKSTGEATETLNFSTENIKDSQLQMLFAVCSPAIASEAQIGLALRVLCGFGIEEIAEAFLSNKETINKRLFRAKEKLRTEQVKMELPPEHEIISRLDNVLHIIYLLFNEGYYSRTNNRVLQKDLCLEATRLGIMLTEYEKTNLPKVNALMALMCFHASRFEARQSNDGNAVLYEQQDEKLWDTTLINQGVYYLKLSALGNEITTYHIEARIAYLHCNKEDSIEKWSEIAELYSQLLTINYSPLVAMSRAFALSKAIGKEAAIAEAEQLQLDGNFQYHLLLGELYKGYDNNIAITHLLHAKALAKTATESEQTIKRINAIEEQ